MRSSLSALLARARRYALGVRPLSGRGSASGGGRLDAQVALDESFLRRLEKLNLLIRGATMGGLSGEHRSRRRASSLEFADYRRYVAGDDTRRVDWNVYGRLGTLFMRLTEAREDVAVHLLLDCSQSMNWGTPSKLLYARELVGALGYLALARFDAVSAATFNDRLVDRFALARGSAQILSLLGFLNSVHVGGATDVGASVATYCAGGVRSGMAVLVSDLLGARGLEAGLNRLLQAGLEVTVVHLLHARELRPELTGELELVDLETGEIVEITVGREAIRSYEGRLAEWCDSIKRLCISRGVVYVPTDTSIALESLILQHLRQRRLVG